MKRNSWLILLLIVLPFAVWASGDKDQDEKNNEKIQWVSIEEVQKLSEKEPRAIFIDVYTDWCGWCKVMDKKTFTDDKVIEYVNENYYAVKLNAESQEKVVFNGQTVTEAQLAQAMGVSSFPTIVLANPEFSQITPAPGYRKAKQFQSMLEDFKKYLDENSSK